MGADALHFNVFLVEKWVCLFFKCGTILLFVCLLKNIAWPTTVQVKPNSCEIDLVFRLLIYDFIIPIFLEK